MKRMTRLVATAIAAVWFVGPMGKDSRADWMWTPESGKWISEKNIEKKSAMMLYEQAQGLEQAGEMAKAIGTYRKLIKQYPASSVAPDAQYWIGHLLEEQGDYYKAFKEYQKVIENYPSYKKFNEILEREYQIGNLYLSGEKMKLLGMAILPAVDKSIEIFETIVRTAPYSSIAPRAQFNIGDAYRKIKHYSEAIPEYQKVIENYPESDLAVEARYQIGQCGYQKTLQASYDQTNTDIALDSMQTFVKKHQDSKKSVEMKQKMGELVARKAKKDFDIAEFYQKSNSEEAAIIYYQEVINNFPETEFAKLASKRIDELVARPTKKKVADENKEVLESGEKQSEKQGEKKGILAKLWPFGKKTAAPANAKTAASATVIAAPEAPEANIVPAQKKSGLLANLWPFGKKEQAIPSKPVLANNPPPAVAKKPAGKKPFWAFWIKEEKKKTSPIDLQDEGPLPYVASQMKLPVLTAPGSRQVKALRLVSEDQLSKTKVVSESPPKESQPRSKPAVLRVKSFQIEEDRSVLRMMFETNGDLEFKTFYLKDPARVLISFSKGVLSSVSETIPVNKLGVQTVRQHFRSKEESATGQGRPLNAIVVDLEKNKEVKVYNDLDTFVIEVGKG